ncbi:hypothetical protein BDN72DRAFT_852604 [Pluteus cervinus]|uniref:Uncharacterized protein n=1 Tax=Pluteus cervinus TaxID=181527 RepID=A0ACD3BIK3_9AGAR|nr:hypothetical protein BDN72DRAFT_852604 [Pluteus cervinus]
MDRNDPNVDFAVTFDTKVAPFQKINKLLKTLVKAYPSAGLGLMCWLSLAGQAHERTALGSMECIYADEQGNMKFEVLVVEGLCNARKVMHGSAMALVFDICSSASMVAISRPGYWAIDHRRDKEGDAQFVGVSRNLNVTAIRPAVVGSTVIVQVRPMHVGARNALLECEMKEKDTGKLVSYGTHDMVNPGGMARERAARAKL